MSILTVTEKKALGAYAENINWFRDNYKKLVKKHPDRFVAIDDGKVIDYDTESRRLIERLRIKHGDQKLTTFAIEFVSSSDIELII